MVMYWCCLQYVGSVRVLLACAYMMIQPRKSNSILLPAACTHNLFCHRQVNMTIIACLLLAAVKLLVDSVWATNSGSLMLG